MNRSRLVGILAVVAFAAGCGGEDTRPVGERFRLVPPELDFGAVPVGGSFLQEVELQNEGRSRLDFRIDKVPEGVEIRPRKGVIAPGRSLRLEVEFSPSNKLPVSDFARLRAAGGAEGKLLIQGKPVGRVLEVQERMDFGEVALGKSATAALEVRSLVDVPLEVQASLEDEETFSLKVWRIPLEPRGTHVLHVGFSPQVRGESSSTLGLLPCEECGISQVTLVGRGMAYGIEAQPGIVDFGRVPPGLEEVRELEVRNIGDIPVELGSIGWTEEGGGPFSLAEVELPKALGIGETKSIPISFAPSDTGEFQAHLRFVDATGSELAEVTVRGIGGGPRLVASPSALDFGFQPLGRGVEKAFVIENVGDPEPVLIQAISVEGKDAGLFEVKGLGLPLEVGPGSAEGIVQLDAQLAGGLEAEVVLQTKLPAQPELRIPLRAHVVDDAQECNLKTDRTAVRFGQVFKEYTAVRRIELQNEGQTECLIWKVEIAGEHASHFELLQEFVPFYLAPGASHGIELSYDASQPPIRVALDANLTIGHGPFAGEGMELPILAFSTNSYYTQKAPVATFESTPVGRATVVSLDLWLHDSVMNFRFTEDSSPAFRFPGSQATGPASVCSAHDCCSVGPICDGFSVPIQVAFIPETQGLHRGTLEMFSLSTWVLPVSMFIELEAFADSPCSQCDWPDPNCEIPSSLDPGEPFLFSEDPSFACNWRVTEPPHKAVVNFKKWFSHAPEFSLAMESSNPCSGTFTGHSARRYGLSNLRVREDGRAAYCEVDVEVVPPEGLWVEAVARGDMSGMRLQVLEGEKNPVLEESWFDEASTCRAGIGDSSGTTCSWGEPGTEDDPTFPEPGPEAVGFGIREPGVGKRYHLGLRARHQNVPHQVPAEIRIFCDRQLIFTQTLQFSADRLIVAGTIEIAPDEVCAYTPDGSTMFLPGPW